MNYEVKSNTTRKEYPLKAFQTFLCSLLISAVLISGAFAATSLKIPYLTNVKIDGNPSDWGQRGFLINQFGCEEGNTSVSLNCKDSVRLGWNEKGLFALFQVHDTTPNEDPWITQLWQSDSIDIFVADRIGRPDYTQLVVSPGFAHDQPEMRFYHYDYRRTPSLKAIPLEQEIARKVIKDGYIIEAFLPWRNLNIAAKEGQKVAIQLLITDKNLNGNISTRVWFPKPGASYDSSTMRTVILSNKTDKPEKYVTFPVASKLWPQEISVIGDASLSGRKVIVTTGSDVVASSVMKASSGRSAAFLSVPSKKEIPKGRSFNVQVDGENSLPVHLGNPYEITRNILRKSPVKFNSYVFEGAEFPAYSLENEDKLHSQIGDYSVTARFFDVNYKEVTKPENPGRYGAIAEIKSVHGISIKQYITLYRQKDPIDWDNLQLSGSIEFPSELGIDPTVCKDQNRTINESIKWALNDFFYRDEYSAICLAGLSEITPGIPACTSRNGVSTRSDNWWYGLRKKLDADDMYHYATRLPKDYTADSSKKWPLLVVLHGAGERAISDEDLWKHFYFDNLYKYTQDAYPMITVIPHCPTGEWWKPIAVKDVIDQVCQKYQVDSKRIYLTGYSMGGYGTFSTAAQYPDLFAAIAPFSGGGDPEDANCYKNIPTWILHGDKDPTVSVTNSIMMNDAIKKTGGDVKLTLYPGVGHNCWEQTFSNPDFYKWFLTHSR